MSADKWCLGYRRDPHVPDPGDLIQVTQPRSFKLCRTCWLAWNASDREVGR